ncbi:MAG TPA: hypothetical protein VE130_13525 [Nitrososphaeraceae archaeon]|nr:hypothetical protein [Nitrososphaeraceae archaeon]
MELSLVRLQQIIKKCFEDIESQETTTKEKHEAAIIIKECSALRLEILGSGVLANELSKQKHALVNSNNSAAPNHNYNNTHSVDYYSTECNISILR